MDNPNPAHMEAEERKLESATSETTDLGASHMAKKNAWDSYDTVFLNAKAGMDGVDKKKVQKVVYDMSKGSKYFSNEQRKEADVLQRIQRMNARAATLTPAQLAEHEKATDLKIAELEATRDLSRIWMHVDMDAFYAAVETLVNPSLTGKPMAVGGMSMICTANYEARKFGVRAAMPGFIARKLCPNLIFVRPDFKKYSHYSELSRRVFKEYDPDFVARSLDEAYIDITNSCHSRDMSAAEVAEELRTKVHSATGLTCSAGVGPNRLLAKVCSDINKPNGQYVLDSDRGPVMTFMSTLPIRKVSGIGKVTERLLKEVLGITICADLLSKRSQISALFSQISTDFFLAVGLGIGGSETPEREQRKSLSNERTFAAICDERQLFKKLEELVDLLVDDMQKEDLHGRTLTLKLKETGFEVRSRAVTLPSYVSTKSEIWEHAVKLLRAELPLSLRLMGLRISNFRDEKGGPSDPSQRTLTSLFTRSSNACNVSPLSTSKAQDKAPEGTDSLCGEGGCQTASAQETSNQFRVKPFEREGQDQKVSNDSAALLDSRQRTSADATVAKSKAFLTRPESSEQVWGEFTGSSILTVNGSGDLTAAAAAASSSIPSVEMGIEAKVTSNVITDIERGKQIQQEGSRGQQSHSLRGFDRYCQTPSYSDVEAGEPVQKKNGEQALYPSFPEDVDAASEISRRTASADTHDDLGGQLALEDAAVGFDTVEPGWEALQSGYDSVQEHIWMKDRCGLCGVEVGDGLPTARQEHEDFHFAVWLQQQAEEGSEIQRPISTPGKKPMRPPAGERPSSAKRKASKWKRNHDTPGKKGSSHRPLEAFFSKAK